MRHIRALFGHEEKKKDKPSGTGEKLTHAQAMALWRQWGGKVKN